MTLTAESANEVDARSGLAATSGTPGRKQVALLVSVGFFVTTLGQPTQIGGLPLRLLLKDRLGVDANAIATFFAIAALGWYLKPVAGLLCDAVPLFGSRRRSYLVFSAAASATLWLSLGQAEQSYMWLLFLAVALNGAIVIASTVLGGVMVEAGRERGITGELVSWKFLANNTAALLVGPLAGYLATRPLWVTGTTGALILLPVALLGAAALRREHASRARATISGAVTQIRDVLASRGLLLATAFIFLVGVNPGFDTPLLFFQTDTRKFEPQFIGWLALVRGSAGLLAAALYAVTCRRTSLRSLLIAGVVLEACGALGFLAYTTRFTAIWIEAAYGFSVTMSMLPVFDLAARSAPRGGEAMGLALIMSLWNIANAISDVIGSWLFATLDVTFLGLVWVNALTTLCIVPFVRFVPPHLIGRPNHATP